MLIIRYVVIKYPTFTTVLTTSANAANKIHMVLFNGSSNIVRIRRIIAHAEVTAAVTGFELSYRINRISGYTGGTTLPITPFNTARALPSGIVSIANPSSVTTTGTIMSFMINPEETGGQHMIDIDCSPFEGEPLTLLPSEGIAIVQYGTAGVGNISINIIFTVE